MNDKPTNPVLMGVIGAPHGVRGQVRVKSHTGDPLALGDYGRLFDGAGRRFEVTDIRPAKGVVVVTLAGVTSREAAEALNGTELFVDRAQLADAGLDDDEFLVADLVGMAAVSGDGAPLGEVVAMHDFGGGDVIELRLQGGGRTELYPFTRDVVPKIDLDARRLTLVPPGEIVARPEEDETP